MAIFFAIQKIQYKYLSQKSSRLHLNHYFINTSLRPSGFWCPVSVNHKIFFSLKLPWNHSLTPWVDPRDWLRACPRHVAPREELECARDAGFFLWKIRFAKAIFKTLYQNVWYHKDFSKVIWFQLTILVNFGPVHLNHYYDPQVCMYVCPSIIIFSPNQEMLLIGSLWDHPLTPWHNLGGTWASFY